MPERSYMSSGLDPVCDDRPRDVRAAAQKPSKSASGAQVLQYGLTAGFISMAILSTFSSFGLDIGSLFESLRSDLLNVTSKM